MMQVWLVGYGTNDFQCEYIFATEELAEQYLNEHKGMTIQKYPLLTEIPVKARR